ncbi:MAG: alcohol dehydrogenase catalytic domain-containing protein [Desulfatitalea sp.]|nr:alcohol dehydrogenase catalytic domain-containing protein [Desulfatitalea sp.]
MQSKVLVVNADHAPMESVAVPGPHQIYRNAQVSVKTRISQRLQPNEIRVEMLYAGVCGTDTHLLTNHSETGYISCSAPCQIPPRGRVMGHEGVGRVIQVGPHIHHVKPGDYVTLESIVVCHSCKPCKAGKFNQCINAKLLGLEKDGVFSGIVDIPGMIAHDITALIKSEEDLQALACIEPASVAYVACRNANMMPGDVVLIFGAGPIGILSAMISKAAFGASQVHIVEPVPFRRQFARKWADYVYSQAAFFESDPLQIDIVLEASGALENINCALPKIKPNGSIVLLARSGGAFSIDHVDHMITNEISISGSRGHLGGAFSRILALYEHGKLSPGSIVTNIIQGLDQLCELFYEKERILNENCKVLVKIKDYI